MDIPIITNVILGLTFSSSILCHYHALSSWATRGPEGSRFISSELGVKLGEVYVASIEEISKRGDSGIAQINGIIVFVPNTKPGDKIRLKITKLGTGYAEGEVMEQTIENHRKNEVEQEEGVLKTEPGPIAMNDDLERERVDE